MSIRFRKSKKIAPGVTLNLGKDSTGVRFGGKGAGITLNTKGNVTASAGVPGTGLYFSKRKNIDDFGSADSSASSDFGSAANGGKPPKNNSKLKKVAKVLWITVAVLVGLFILLMLIPTGGDDSDATTSPVSDVSITETQPTASQTEATVSEKQTDAPTTEKQTAAPATEKQTAAPATEAQTQAPANPVQSSHTYILNENTGKYHKSGCSTIKDSKNLREISADEAKNYSPCGRCKP